MKRKILFWVALATMLWTGGLTHRVSANGLNVLGDDITIKTGITSIGTITIEQNVDDRALQINFGKRSEKTLNVLSSANLISYKGDDFDYILVSFDEDLEINHSVEEKMWLFDFDGRGSKPIQIYFMNNSQEDITLKINSTYENEWQSVFYLRNVRLHLNHDDIGIADKDKLRKLNLDINTASEFIFNDNQEERAYVDLGYGDYHFAFTNAKKQGEVFHSNIMVSGLGRFDTYDEHNYISSPHGLVFYFSGYSAHLYECGVALEYKNRYLGEVTLTYAPSEWQYFDPDEYSSWKLQQSCDGITLKLTCSGDLSSLNGEDLPWNAYKDLITDIELQEDVMIPCTKLPKRAFKGFTALRSATMYGMSGLTEFAEGLFEDCPELAEVTFPYMNDGIVIVGKKAFYNCGKLTTVELPESIEQIGDSAFFHCSQSEVTLPKSLKKVGYRAFNDCHIVTMPKGLGEKIEAVERNESINASFNVFDLTRLIFEGTMEEWLARDNSWIMASWSYNNNSTGGYLNIGGEDIVDLVIPEGTTSLKPYAFANAARIKTVTFPSTLTSIGNCAFYKNERLEAADLPDNITEIGEKCFMYSGIETLKLPANLTVIPKEAFSGCVDLASVTLPEGLTTIGNAAFAECTSLMTIALPDAITTLAPFAFSSSMLTEITLPKNLQSISATTFFACIMLSTVNIPASMGDVEYDLTGVDELSEEQKAYLGFPFVTDIRFGGDLDEWLVKSRPWLMSTLPENLIDWINEVEIPHKVNLYLAGSDEPLQDVVIPEGVTAIPEDAFHMTTVTSLSIPQSVTEVGAHAFAGCKGLIAAESRAAIPPTIGEDAFSGIHEDAGLDVFASAVDAYQASDWSNYFAINGAFAEYRVTAAASDEALGEVSLTFDKEDIISEEGKNSFVVGNNAKAHLVATPKGKARFVRWDDDGNDYGMAVRDVTINGDFNFVAQFEKDSFNVSVTINGIDPSEVEIHGAGRYGEGDEATLTFTLKNDHYLFENWTYDGKFWESEETLELGEITKNRNVQIYFSGKKYAVTATVIPAGAGEVLGQGEYAYGSTYGLKVVPAEGYELKEWRDGIALDEKSDVLTGMVYGNTNIEVVLQLKKYTITVTVNDEAMGTAIGGGTYEHGSTVQIGAFAKEGYEFVRWSNGAIDNPLSFTATEDMSLQAVFQSKTGTGVEEVESGKTKDESRKVVRNGILYILLDGKTYNAQGQMVR